MARTQGRITGVKRSSETIATVTGTIATHVEASNEDRISIEGMVRDFATTADLSLVARTGIKVNGKMLAELALQKDGTMTLLLLNGTEVKILS